MLPCALELERLDKETKYECKLVVSAVLHSKSPKAGLLTVRIALSILLTHGSVVLQEGKALQEVLEHQAALDWEPHRHTGGSRLAATARWIDEKPRGET